MSRARVITVAGAAAGALALAGAAGCEPSRGEPGLCTPGDGRCSENAYEVCDSSGNAWVVAEDCAAAQLLCVTNLGCRTCSPNAIGCGGDGFDVTRCSSDGHRLDVVGRCDPESGQLCTVGGLCADACEVASATRSYEGCEYWAIDLDNAVTNNQGPAAAQQFSVVVSNPLELPAQVKVEVNDAPPGEPPLLRVVASASLDRVVGGGDLAIIDLDPREVDCASDARLNDGPHTCLSSKAYKITSTAPIVAYQFNPLENVSVFSNDASLLLPTSALDNQYIVLSWPQTLATTDDALTNGGIDLRAFLTVVGTEEATTVTIVPTTRTLAGGGLPEGLPGQPMEVALGPFDVINLETDDFMADFTGTVVVANRPVAVFTGSEASDAPLFDDFSRRQCCADHLEEQLFPESALGTTFVATIGPRRTFYVDEAGWSAAVQDSEHEVWRVLGTAEDTTVATNLPTPWDSFTLHRGDFVTFETARDFVLTASAPVAVAAVQTGQQAVGIVNNLPGGDPSLTMVPPSEQWRDKYVFLVPNKYAFDFLLLAFPKGADLYYDGLPLEEALPRCEYASAGFLVENMVMTEYISARCPLSLPTPAAPNDPIGQDDGRHTLFSAGGEPFGLVVYGFDRFVSYAYPGGSNVGRINPL